MVLKSLWIAVKHELFIWLQTRAGYRVPTVGIIAKEPGFHAWSHVLNTAMDTAVLLSWIPISEVLIFMPGTRIRSLNTDMKNISTVRRIALSSAILQTHINPKSPSSPANGGCGFSGVSRCSNRITSFSGRQEATHGSRKDGDAGERDTHGSTRGERPGRGPREHRHKA